MSVINSLPMFVVGIDSSLTIVLKLFLAALCGIIIGYDREISGKPAGIRTQMLVCLGSALMASISVDIAVVLTEEEVASKLYNLDPSRLMAQVISGVGFLGAGVILKNGSKIQGVTTAATIWIAAAIGIAIGAGFFLPAGIATILVLLLNPLARLQYKYGLKGDFYTIKVNLKDQKTVESITEEIGIEIKQRSVTRGSIVFTIHSSNQKNKLLIDKLTKKKSAFELKITQD